MEHAEIEYNLVFEVLCNHQIRKVYRLRLFEGNAPNVNASGNGCVNSLSIRPALLYKAIQYLQTRDEIVLKVLPNAVSIENIPVEGEVRTVSNLNTGDMDEFSIPSPTSLRFFTNVVFPISIECRGFSPCCNSRRWLTLRWFSVVSAREGRCCTWHRSRAASTRE